MHNSAPSPVRRPSAARGNCVQIPAFLHTLLALLATLIGRRALAAHVAGPAFADLVLADMAFASARSTPVHAVEPARSYTAYDALVHAVLEAQSAAPHGGCRANILYVLGPRPNRGMRFQPRPLPLIPRPAARPPPPSAKSPLSSRAWAAKRAKGWVRGRSCEHPC